MPMVRCLSDPGKHAQDGCRHRQYSLDEIMIFNQGYSHKTKQIARERIEKLKEQNQQEIIIRKQKIKELSKQTNELRKKIKDKSQTLQEDEEERRATILENRKLKQRIATEKFQRIKDKRSKGKKPDSKNNLKNGMYHVRGHVIEIRDGIRVNSTKQDDPVEKMDETPPQHNKSYAPNVYLSNHLSELINTDLSQANKKECKHNKYSIIEPNNVSNNNNNNNNNNNKNNKNTNTNTTSTTTNNNNSIDNNNNQKIKDVLNDLRCDAQFIHRKISEAEQIDSDSDCEVCSTDSLEDPGESSTQKMLKSSLKLSRDGLNDSINRKVTFSDSIEFNDGNIGRLEIKPLERVPLYQRIENRNKEEIKPVNNITPANKNSNNTKQHALTAEEVLDQLREEALMSKFPEVNNITYPESVTAALEQLSQTRKFEKEMNREDKDEVAHHSLKNYDSDFQIERNNPSYVIRNVPVDAIDEKNGHAEHVPYHSNNESLRKVNNDVIENEKNSINITGGLSTPSPSMSCVHAPTLPISELNTLMYRHDNSYQSSNISYGYKSSENQSQKLSSCLSISPYTSHSQTSVSSNISKSSHRSHENNDTDPSGGVLYIPKYPYFPSKQHQYATNGEYDGKSPMNYYESQYINDYRNATSHYNQTSHITMVSSVTNGYHTTFTSPTTSSHRNNRTGDTDTEGLARELSLSYINRTTSDISKPEKPNDIYQEVEQTLSDITFAKKEKHSNDSIQQHLINTTDRKALATDDLKTPETCERRLSDAGSNESKILSAIKDGTAIPIRVHTNSTNEANPMRRGRVIVSADSKKRRQVGNMLPRPPVKSKAHTEMEKNHKLIAGNKNDQSKDEKSSPTTNSRIPDKTGPDKKLNIFENRKRYCGNTSDDNSLQAEDKRTHPQVDPQRIPVKTNYDYFSDQYSDRNGINNRVDSRIDFNNNNNNNNNNTSKFSSTPPTNNLPKSYVRVSPNTLPWAKSCSKSYYQKPLDKTPTDDEINKLWINVRECIYTEQTEHAYSDSNYVIDNRHRKQHRRTQSGSSLRKKLDDRPAPRMYTNYSPLGMNRRYGSHDSLNRQIVNDSFSPMVNKPALLPQRATKIIRNSNSSNENKYTVFKGNDNLSNGDRYQYDTQTGKYGDVTTSMASFLVLEELCKKQSLTPRQADAVFQASNSIQKKLDKEKAGISALSVEERCVMESLERLNEKLKEKGFKAGGHRHVSSKPPIPEQRRRLYPNQ